MLYLTLPNGTNATMHSYLDTMSGITIFAPTDDSVLSASGYITEIANNITAVNNIFLNHVRTLLTLPLVLLTLLVGDKWHLRLLHFHDA
jgi:hypothetical protein